MQPVVYTIAQYYETDRAASRKYVLEQHPLRVRGTPEYNPLYEAFGGDSTVPQRQTRNNFRPITPPPVAPPRVIISQSTDGRESIYDRSRSSPYFDNDGSKQHQNQSTTVVQRQHTPRSQRKVESSPSSEIDYLMDKVGGNPAVGGVDASKKQKRRSRYHLLNNVFDFLAIVATALVFGLIYLLIKPVQRGFYCDDTSIQYPFKADTIPMWLLGIYGGVGPVIIFFIVEIWVVRPFHCRRGPAKKNTKERQIDYLKAIFHTTFLFILGIAVCFLITEVGKRTIGRLRPYYLTVCNPIWANINCTKTVASLSGPVTISQYVLQHNCNSSLSAIDLQEAKLSFPSGHSSYSTYAFVFLFVYFEARLVCPKVQFLKPFLQCLCIAIAFFTCLSRVTDYKHHSTDVIGGALIGFSIAIFTAVRVGTYLWKLSVYCETEDETEKDRLPKEERIQVPGIETTQTGGLRSNDQNQQARARNGNRSNYDNVMPIHQPLHNVPPQQQQRNMNNSSAAVGSKRISPGRAYEEQPV